MYTLYFDLYACELFGINPATAELDAAQRIALRRYARLRWAEKQAEQSMLRQIVRGLAGGGR